jgi:hypothetical protein
MAGALVAFVAVCAGCAFVSGTGCGFFGPQI